MVDLSLALCPSAHWTGTDAAIKMHTMLDLRGPLPPFISLMEVHADRADAKTLLVGESRPTVPLLVDKSVSVGDCFDRKITSGATLCVQEKQRRGIARHVEPHMATAHGAFLYGPRRPREIRPDLRAGQ